MARQPLHERSLWEQWTHALFAPRHLLVKAAVLAGFVFLLLPSHTRALVLNGVIYYVVVIGVIVIGFKMLLGVIAPPKKKKKEDH